MNKVYITPGIKLIDLFNNYPDLEVILLELIPSLNKIKSDLVKKSIYSTTSLDVACKSANIELSSVINTLREKVGQNTMNTNTGNAPEWANIENTNRILDAIPLIAAGEHPLTEFMQIASEIKDGEVILLITPFLPGPLIEKAIEKGLNNWTQKKTESLYYNYFQK